MNKDPLAILQKYWGFSSFRGSQEQIIAAVLDNTDVMALLPTGGGKSVCYQIPALAKEGICIVVSPLIALIHDQVNSLKIKGIKALALTGGIPFEEVIELLDNCLFGNYKFLYLSPERLQQNLVQERIAQMHVNLIAIDEAHCISEWGNDFRPAYLNCSVLRQVQPKVPIIALTATATLRVENDIIESLLLTNFLSFKDSFSRENIVYKVLQAEDKLYRLKQLCKATKKSGIVYVRTRRSAEELSRYLNKNNIKTTYFHGGINKHEKKLRLEQWLNNTTKIIVATNAFGMGVDKADVSLVLHYHIPDSIENYFQESGRAGRDGNSAEAVIVTNKNDELQLEKQFLSVLPDVPFLKLLYKKLNTYFQIPYNGGANEKFQFRLNEFCELYELNTILTYNGLRLLDQNSILAMSQEYAQNTKVRFLASKKQLFSYLDKHRSTAQLVQVILRTYGGIFDYDTKINPVLISKKAGVDEARILNILAQLHKDGIIDYQARHSDLEITFLVPREDDLTINSIAKKVEDHQRIKKENVASMLAYIHTTNTCRNRQLLSYFGEEKKESCGKCDVCMAGSKFDAATQQEIINGILDALEGRQCSSRGLIKSLPFVEQQVLEALQILLEDRKVTINAKNEYSII